MGKPSRYDDLKKGYTCVAMMPQQGMSVFLDGDNGQLYAKNSFGWTVMLTDQQWQDLYWDGTICMCGMCVPCGIREITEDLINEKDETAELAASPEVSALLASIFGKAKR